MDHEEFSEITHEIFDDFRIPHKMRHKIVDILPDKKRSSRIMKNDRLQAGVIIFAVDDRIKVKNYDHNTRGSIDGQNGTVKWAEHQNNLQVELDSGKIIDCNCWQLDHILTY